MTVPLEDTVTVRLADGTPVDVAAHVGRPTMGTPSSDGPGALVAVDRLVILTDPGALPPSLTVGAVDVARVEYQGRMWDAVTTQLTRRVHGDDHHTSVIVQAATAVT